MEVLRNELFEDVQVGQPTCDDYVGGDRWDNMVTWESDELTHHHGMLVFEPQSCQ